MTPMPDDLKRAWRRLAQRHPEPEAAEDDAPEDDDPDIPAEDDHEPAEEIPGFDDDIPF